MADVITRFKLETTQFDSKLRDTSKALRDIAHQAELGGKDFDKFSDEAIKSARALGTVQSGATNTKDKLRDLVGSYNDAAKAYNSLTETAKKGEFGQAMSQSLTQLQQRIKETKEELYNLGDSVKGKGGLFGEDGLTGMLQVFGGNLLTKGFEMLASGISDTWTKSIELARAGEGVRIAFERLNQPGLLDRLKEATHGTVSEVELMKQAIKFENFKLPLEDLATYLSFAQQKAKDTGESIDYLVNSIVNGLGRQSKQILDNLGISAAELTKRMAEGATITQAVADIIREEMEKAGDYVETAADRAAKAAAKATDEMEKFGQQAAPIAEAWGETWNAISIGAMELANTLLGPVAESIRTLQNIWNNGWEDNVINSPYNIENGKYNPKSGYQGMGDLQKVTAPGGYVEVTDKNTGEVLGGKHFDNLDDKNTINAWRKSLTKTTKTKTSTGKTLEEKIAWDPNKANLAATKAIDTMPSVWAMMGGDEGLRQMMGIGRKQFDLGRDITEHDYKKLPGYKDEKETRKLTEKISTLTSGLSSIASGLKSMGIDLPKEVDQVIGVIQGITSVIEGVNSVISIFSTSAMAANTAAIVANTAALIANSTTNLIPLAGGGIVPHAAGGYLIGGNNYSGDKIFAGHAWVNSGELVLNRAQQGNLASQLEGGGMGAMQLSAVITGEQLRLVLNNNGRRTGRGEYVTTNFR